MIDYNQAKEIVDKRLSKLPIDEVELQIIEEDTVEYEFGWVFFYNSKEYLDTGNTIYALAGNAPLIVDKQDGSVHQTGTAHPIDHYIKQYKETKQQK